MSDTGRVRWYRHGGARLLGTLEISFLCVIASWLAVWGIGHPVRWILLIPGIVLTVAFAVAAVLPMRAGIGVTAEHVLIRAGTGGTRVVPWAQVTGFEAGRGRFRSNGKDTVVVVTSDGRRLHTLGYGDGVTSETEIWQLLRVLEDERLARVPGAVSSIPPRPSPDSWEKPGEKEATAILAGAGVIALMLFGALPMYFAITELGPAIAAAHGEGTPGYFIPQRETTGRGATWYGEFRLPDGTVTIRDASIEDVSVSAMRVGVPVAARATGPAQADFPPGTQAVFPRDDPGAWHLPANMAIMGGWSWAWVIVLLSRAAARRLGPSRHASG